MIRAVVHFIDFQNALRGHDIDEFDLRGLPAGKLDFHNGRIVVGALRLGGLLHIIRLPRSQVAGSDGIVAVLKRQLGSQLRCRLVAIDAKCGRSGKHLLIGRVVKIDVAIIRRLLRTNLDILRNLNFAAGRGDAKGAAGIVLRRLGIRAHERIIDLRCVLEGDRSGSDFVVRVVVRLGKGRGGINGPHRVSGEVRRLGAALRVARREVRFIILGSGEGHIARGIGSQRRAGRGRAQIQGRLGGRIAANFLEHIGEGEGLEVERAGHVIIGAVAHDGAVRVLLLLAGVDRPKNFHRAIRELLWIAALERLFNRPGVGGAVGDGAGVVRSVAAQRVSKLVRFRAMFAHGNAGIGADFHGNAIKHLAIGHGAISCDIGREIELAILGALRGGNVVLHRTEGVNVAILFRVARALGDDHAFRNGDHDLHIRILRERGNRFVGSAGVIGRYVGGIRHGVSKIRTRGNRLRRGGRPDDLEISAVFGILVRRALRCLLGVLEQIFVRHGLSVERDDIIAVLGFCQRGEWRRAEHHHQGHEQRQPLSCGSLHRLTLPIYQKL